MSFARRATWAACIDNLAFSETETVPVAVLVRQRKALANMHDAFQGERSIARLRDAAVQAASAGCASPMAKVLELQRADNTLILKAQVGMGAAAVGREAGTADAGNPPGEALISARPVVIANVPAERGARAPAILREYRVVTSVSLPLIGAEGPYGILEVDYDQQHEVDASHLSFLASIAAILAEGVESRQRHNELAEERDTKVTLLREQQHRIRNNFQMITALLERRASECADPAVQKGYREVERRVFAMASLYDHLLGLGEHQDSVDLGAYLENMCASFEDFYDLPGNDVSLALALPRGAATLPIDTCAAVGTVVNELVANAVEHAFVGCAGEIRVAMQRMAAGVEIEVSDNGCGYAPGASESTGLSTVRRIVGSFGGQLRMQSAQGGGTRWTLTVNAPD
ncbi:histidine kinase dimerization/phosphoacceptor domain -containing protein [Caballeronia sp. GAFFF1]|uniref:sensor histidine kinase n=1 Tax=Caballeronia sp. GAFFF1 TaxID=2921779 RepID=UPI002027C92E|nr:histidine kinase dimerization/phosphoacceptor domain -containing protein [Caballeronia sp. GAFFF1]